MTRPHVVVVGGGLAGLSAALGCADGGAEVTLLEARPRLGGQTFSFTRGELTVDNGQHVFLRCCTSYRALLARLGVEDLVSLDRLDVPVTDARTGGSYRLTRGLLPAPLHLTGSLLRYRAVSPLQRLHMVRAVLALRRVDTSSPTVDRTSFGDWLRGHGQDARTIEAVWDLIGIATLNARADQASLSLAATVFQIGLLSKAADGDIGWSRVPLQRLHADPAAAELSRLGATVRLSTKVERLEQASDGWSVTLRDGDRLRADAVVLAVPAAAAERLLPVGAVPAAPGWSERLGASPILNAHLVYDRVVLDRPFLAGLGSVVPWVFDCTGPVGLTQGQAITVPISAADELIDLPTAQVRVRVEQALARLLPGTRQAVLRDFFVTRERDATFRPSPGSHALRAATSTSLPGLVLAGAWTDTGWPATMEGAVRSGNAAAAAALVHRTMPAHAPLAGSRTDGVPA